MAKSIFEEMGGTYEMQGDYHIPYLTNRKGTADRHIWEAAFAVLKGTSQDYLHSSAHKRQAEYLPCRH